MRAVVTIAMSFVLLWAAVFPSVAAARCDMRAAVAVKTCPHCKKSKSASLRAPPRPCCEVHANTDPVVAEPAVSQHSGSHEVAAPAPIALPPVRTAVAIAASKSAFGRPEPAPVQVSRPLLN